MWVRFFGYPNPTNPIKIFRTEIDERERERPGLLAGSISHLSSPPRRIACSKQLKARSGIYCQKWGTLHQIAPNSHHYLSYKRPLEIVQAAVIPISTSLVDNEDQRQQTCEKYGFTQIGEPLPDNITLKDVMDTLPKKVFEIDDMKAWRSVLISVTSHALGILMISKVPWYLLPLAWAWTVTAVTVAMTVLTNHFRVINWWKDRDTMP